MSDILNGARAVDISAWTVMPAVGAALAPSPVQLDETSLELDRATLHGEHTDALPAELGFSEDETLDFNMNSVVL